MKPNQLKQLLFKYRVPYEMWGKRNSISQPLESLLSEINRGVSCVEDRDETLFRITSIIDIHLYYRLAGDVWHELTEKRRVTPRGTEKVYHRRAWGINRKIRPGINQEEAAKRVLRNDLGIKARIKLFRLREETETNFEPRSFPGLPSMRTHVHFVGLAPKGLYHLHDLTDRHEDGTKSYLEWQPVFKSFVPTIILEAARATEKPSAGNRP